MVQLPGCVAAVMSAKKFKPVSSVILHDMSPDVQQRLIAIVHVSVALVAVLGFYLERLRI